MYAIYPYIVDVHVVLYNLHLSVWSEMCGTRNEQIDFEISTNPQKAIMSKWKNYYKCDQPDLGVASFTSHSL